MGTTNEHRSEQRDEATARKVTQENRRGATNVHPSSAILNRDFDGRAGFPFAASSSSAVPLRSSCLRGKECLGLYRKATKSAEADSLFGFSLRLSRLCG